MYKMMKSFKQYLAEDSEQKISNEISQASLSPHEMAQIIKKYCQPFFKSILSKKPLLRGMGKTNEVIMLKKVRKDRVPTDSPLLLHDAYNAYFRKKFGFPYRSASMFCSYQLDVNIYGNTYIVYPVGKFEWCSSNVFKDLYIDIFRPKDKSIKHSIAEFYQEKGVIDGSYRIAENFVRNFNQEELTKETLVSDMKNAEEDAGIFDLKIKDSEYVNFIQKIAVPNSLNFAQYKENSDVEDSDGNGNEIMVKCDSYIAVSKRLQPLGQQINEILWS